MLPIGAYRTKAGSTMTVSGAHGGISTVNFDWLEESNACVDCAPEAYDDDGYLVWHCDVCGGGSAELVATDAPT